MNIKKILIIIIFLAISYSLTPIPSLAQQVNLSLDPPIVQAKIKPGKSIIVGYTAVNLGDPTNLQFLIRPFIPQGQQGSLSVNPLLEGPVQFNLENADIVLEKPFFFPSNEKRQAVVRIYIPPGIPDGDYYYLVMVETVPAFSVAGQSTGIASASIGSPLLISITDSGITEVKATIAEFSFKPDYVFTVGNNIVRIVDNAKELPVVLSVRNVGKNLIQPQGTIVDLARNSKKTYSIISQNVLSNSQRILKASSEENAGLPNSSLIFSHLSIGSHTITAEVLFGENGLKESKSFEFIALPVRLIIITLVVLIVVGIFFLIRLRKMKE